MRVDLNSDLGEGARFDEEIFALVSSANIACGFHAGSPASIFASVEAAKKHGVSVGAHPSFDDRANFGRKEIQLAQEEIFALVAYQLGAFEAVCRSVGVEMSHVKPHGALYNMSARDRALADPIAQAVRELKSNPVVFAQPGSSLEQAARDLNLRTAAEVFADRNYNADGSLVARTKPDALLHDPQAAAERVMRMLREKKVRATDGTDVPISAETVCVHSDTPGAVEFARQLRTRLEREGILIAPPK